MLVDRKDLGVYQRAVRTSAGRQKEETTIEDALLVYVERGNLLQMDSSDSQEVLPVSFDYGRWLGNS